MTDPEPFVLVADDGPVRTFTLNEPARRNPLSVPLRRALRDALEAAHADDACRALVLTGAGQHFSSGGDISSMPQAGAGGATGRLDARADARDRLHLVADVISLLVEGPLPVVAAVEGAAVGAGTSLAVACDYVVSARGAKYGSIFGRIGLVADSGLSWTLPRRVGPGAARRMMMRGNVVGRRGGVPARPGRRARRRRLRPRRRHRARARADAGRPARPRRDETPPGRPGGEPGRGVARRGDGPGVAVRDRGLRRGPGRVPREAHPGVPRPLSPTRRSRRPPPPGGGRRGRCAARTPRSCGRGSSAG